MFLQEKRSVEKQKSGKLPEAKEQKPQAQAHGNVKQETAHEKDKSQQETKEQKLQAQLLELTGTAKSQLAELDNKLRRPRPTMNYRVYPRLTEEIRNILGGLSGAQARPTQGLLTALGELESEKAERARELERILNTTIKSLNEMLDQFPKIMPPAGGGR